MNLYDHLMRFTKNTLFDMCREVGLKAPRGYCWVVGGELQCIPPNEGGTHVPGASQDDAARALADWLQS